MRKGTRAMDLDAIFGPEPEDGQRYQALYESLIAERGKEAAAEIGLELEIALQSQEVRRFILARKTYGLEGALDTMLESARISLADGISKGESLSELAARLVDKFDEFEGVNALRIARTETVSAFNFATAEAWRQSGEVESMEWLSARDSAVRESHAAEDGHTARLGEAFPETGCEFPGDPSAPPEETINCRCTVLPVLTERAKRRRMARFFPQSVNGNGVAH